MPEERPFQFHSRTRQHGKSTMIADCPFCAAAVVVFVWSLNGCGKKRCSCGAMLHRDGTARR